MIVEDKVAQKLEAAGLWRRAANRWLDVMLHHKLTDQQRDWVRQRRKYCLSYTRSSTSTDKLDVAEIVRAVKVAQEQMGLNQPGGVAFRLKGREKAGRLGARSGNSSAVDGMMYGNDSVAKDILIHFHGIDINPENSE